MSSSTMAAQIIDGKEVAKSVRKALKGRIRVLAEQGVQPGLAAVLVGDDPASATYVHSKAKACEKLKLYSRVIVKAADTTQAELLQIVNDLNADAKIHGILVQSPLPSHIDELAITLAISPDKDVDGFHPHNVGLVLLGRPSLLPCTPFGIVKLLEHYQLDPAGKEVVIVGRSNIVGKPVAAMLLQKGPMANATVTVAHSRSVDLPSITRRADIVIAAVGRPDTITADMIKDQAVVIDVGVNRVDAPDTEKGYRLVGDVDFEGCAARASWITPVPGGVGRMTIAMLMVNTVTAAELLSL
ncbi:MAG: bifunctional 5,10-methylene-tetrahydrofolate dehydrogenase/5,10-methylene-tetrahydrofolate cyclohydrolase [candidate division Zixibacteria bacterium]|nr:bifunctional 5,10-methylene-tetrahydrofolate dehydrogenase/5,10-methylene-tetrahydrofolate cyclohydrolase [candidate division Zixibacteria bacterium]MDH3937901.1 bifunctional 5,10-methylene-tetrahydrofolate dehydrogenase/5,10-methylene-tetrahydrofolate cyclohydrolase [candidate division Zixibacteria bacterium]MDH4034034.1 bifunctional 5,10-methylene-tetrahydrofolate dehydrogenase/5,10-methylene-tetrahydrofolate cyclohydrolase [candidate division Zixibacteria bacterium]